MMDWSRVGRCGGLRGKVCWRLPGRLKVKRVGGRMGWRVDLAGSAHLDKEIDSEFDLIFFQHR
jgi:hypothetical protein